MANKGILASILKFHIIWYTLTEVIHTMLYISRIHLNDPPFGQPTKQRLKIIITYQLLMEGKTHVFGAGSENRTRVISLEG